MSTILFQSSLAFTPWKLFTFVEEVGVLSNSPKSSMELTFLKTIYQPVSKIFENPLKIENCFQFIMKLTLRKQFRSQDQENTNQQNFHDFKTKL